jgi:hypothetical protein
MNFKYSFVTCLLKYIFTVSIANCVFTYSTLLSMFVKNDKNVALALKGVFSLMVGCSQTDILRQSGIWG